MGKSVGAILGCGVTVGWFVGVTDGRALGTLVGAKLGISLGTKLGLLDGILDGAEKKEIAWKRRRLDRFIQLQSSVKRINCETYNSMAMQKELQKGHQKEMEMEQVIPWATR